MTNAPPRFESFLLMPGEKKMTIEKDTKVPNACCFYLNKEDHTLGNIIRDQLLRDPKVIFAGCRWTHPLENRMMIRVQTTPDWNPQNAFTQSWKKELKKKRWICRNLTTIWKFYFLEFYFLVQLCVSAKPWTHWQENLNILRTGCVSQSKNTRKTWIIKTYWVRKKS